MGGQRAREAGSKGLEKTQGGVRAARSRTEADVFPPLSPTCDPKRVAVPLRPGSRLSAGRRARTVSLPRGRPVGRADLYGIPQLVGQIVRADAVGEALRQEHGREAGEGCGSRPGGPPSAAIPSLGSCWEGPREPPPAPPPSLPPQAPVGGGEAAPGRPGTEPFRAQLRLETRAVSHFGTFLRGLGTRNVAERGGTAFPARLRRLCRCKLPPRRCRRRCVRLGAAQDTTVPPADAPGLLSAFVPRSVCCWTSGATGARELPSPGDTCIPGVGPFQLGAEGGGAPLCLGPSTATGFLRLGQVSVRPGALDAGTIYYSLLYPQHPTPSRDNE